MATVHEIPKIPKISEDQITPLTAELIRTVHLQQEVIRQLKGGIAELKGQDDKYTENTEDI
ncbi:MAG: hypothetical protein GY710_24640 [Desulfobacteraceae bacterium]|nr:hypothetical protein [Desulfobacteraceae bacterium]